MFFILLILYSLVPVFVGAIPLRYIYPKRVLDLPAWHFDYLIKLLTLVSFIPLLYLPTIDLGLKPTSNVSILLLLVSLIFPLFGIVPALKRTASKGYVMGIYAGFMEEILYRGVVFGLAKFIWSNNLIALVVSSLAFGIWHLKNIYWLGRRRTIKEFFYTAFVFGPIFCLERIFMGDLSLAILHHIITDSTVALTPTKYRWFIIDAQHGEEKDDFVAKDYKTPLRNRKSELL